MATKLLHITKQKPANNTNLPLINSNPSISVTFAIHQPIKIKFKIPKHLGKAMQNRGDKKKKWGKFGWLLFSIFSRKNGGSDSSAEAKILKKKRVESDWIGHQLLQLQNEEQKKVKPKKAVSGFFKGCSFKFKSNKTDSRVSEIVIGRQESKGVAAIRRVPSRILSPGRRVKIAKSLTKISSRGKSARQDDECEEFLAKVRSQKEDGDVEELCKKRILMGEKCKPLSGTLQYDYDGVLLPDITP